MPRHIIHLAVKPHRQPFCKTRLFGCQVNACHADSIEAQRTPVRLDRGFKPLGILPV